MTFRIRSRASLAAALLASGLLLTACDSGSDRGQSLYDPARTEAARRTDPTLTGLVPQAGSVLIGGKSVAGVTTLVLTGTGFVKDSTYVYFNGVRVPIVSISPTEIVVQAPNLIADNVNVKVMRLGAVNFSQVKTVSIATAIERFGLLGPVAVPFGVAPMSPTTAYVHVQESGSPTTIRVATMAGTTNGIPATNTTWAELAYLNNYVYGVRGVAAVFRIPTPSGPPQAIRASTDGNALLSALDVEADGTIWSGGSYTGGTAASQKLYRTPFQQIVNPPATGTIDASGITTAYPFGGTITAIDATPAAVFVAGTVGTQTGVWRYARTGASLGTPTLLAEFPSTLVLNTLAATADGGVLVGVAPSNANLNATFADPLRRVAPNGTVSVHLPGLLSKGITHMRWLDSRHLLVSGAALVGNADSQKLLSGDLLRVDPLMDGLL